MTVPLRAALYLRVSTAWQAEHDVVRKLAKNGVKLLSITQEMGDDPMHVMMRQIMALFDEYRLLGIGGGRVHLPRRCA